MTGATHHIIGAGIGLGVATVHPVYLPFPESSAPAIFAQVVLGAICGGLPDIDLRIGLPHRGPTHSFAFVLLLTVLAAAASHALLPAAAGNLILIVFLALVSHLLADLTNPTPMEWLWPLTLRRMRPSWLPSATEKSLRGRLVEVVTVVAIVAVLLPFAGPRVLEVLR